MAELNRVEDVISLLRQIEQRSQLNHSEFVPQDQHTKSWSAISFTLAEQEFLVPLIQIKELFPVPTQVTQVPLAQPWVYGIANLRGELLPLFDLQYFLYNTHSRIDKHSRVLVLNHAEHYLGLIVENVLGIRNCNHLPTKSNETISPEIAEFIDGMVHYRDQQHLVFSFQQLIENQRFLHAAI